MIDPNFSNIYDAVVDLIAASNAHETAIAENTTAINNNAAAIVACNTSISEIEADITAINGEISDITADTGWIDMTLAEGWSMNDYNTDKPQYRKIGNRVFFRGLVNATAAAGTQITTLPIGFRPSANFFSRWRCAMGYNNDAVNIQVGTNGIVQDYNKTTNTSRSFISLSGISYLTTEQG